MGRWHESGSPPRTAAARAPAILVDDRQPRAKIPSPLRVNWTTRADPRDSPVKSLTTGYERAVIATLVRWLVKPALVVLDDQPLLCDCAPSGPCVACEPA